MMGTMNNFGGAAETRTGLQLDDLARRLEEIAHGLTMVNEALQDMLASPDVMARPACRPRLQSRRRTACAAR
jgi:hypothetical protein